MQRVTSLPLGAGKAQGVQSSRRGGQSLHLLCGAAFSTSDGSPPSIPASLHWVRTWIAVALSPTPAPAAQWREPLLFALPPLSLFSWERWRQIKLQTLNAQMLWPADSATLQLHFFI